MSGVEQLLQCTASHSTLIPGYSCPSLQQKMDDGRRSRSRSPLRILITAQHDSQHITSVRVENGYYATTSTTTVWRHDPTWAAGRAPTVPTVRVSRGGGGEDGDDRDAEIPGRQQPRRRRRRVCRRTPLARWCTSPSGPSSSCSSTPSRDSGRARSSGRSCTATTACSRRQWHEN